VIEYPLPGWIGTRHPSSRFSKRGPGTGRNHELVRVDLPGRGAERPRPILFPDEAVDLVPLMNRDAEPGEHPPQRAHQPVGPQVGVTLVQVAASEPRLQRRLQGRNRVALEPLRRHPESVTEQPVGVGVVLERLPRLEHEQQPLRFPLAADAPVADQFVVQGAGGA